jgi:hypothetical protein
MSSRRWADENRVATQNAPAKQRLLVEGYRRIATSRKLTLLDVAIVRHAPFDPAGHTIWELVPDYSWFKDSPVPTSRELTVHHAIAIVEDMADARATDEEIEDARRVLEYAEYSAEADRFGYDPVRAVGSELRYGVAYWVTAMAHRSEHDWNLIDFYLTASSGTYYAWAREEPLHPDHRTVSLSLLRDVLGATTRRTAFSPAWRTSIAVALADTMYAARDFANMPVLADALEEGGCDNADVLAHCRGPEPHVRGCWVVDLVLGKT